jgi:GAF domain-containing protein
MTEPERSVLHFSSRADLADSLMENKSDWELTNYNACTTTTSAHDEEVDRLMVLKSYNILESEIEPEFEEITKEAAKAFNVPIAVVSLVDFGRQWFKSIQGLDAKSTPRSCAFCAHTIQLKDRYDVLVVPDATKDDRFKDNPLVTGGPKIRFYAGAPLLSPEGPRIGAFCIIDYKPRPEGLTVQEILLLQTFSTEAVYNAIQRGPS